MKKHVPAIGFNGRIYDPIAMKGFSFCGRWWVDIAEDNKHVTCKCCQARSRKLAKDLRKKTKNRQKP